MGGSARMALVTRAKVPTYVPDRPLRWLRFPAMVRV